MTKEEQNDMRTPSAFIKNAKQYKIKYIKAKHSEPCPTAKDYASQLLSATGYAHFLLTVHGISI